MELPLPAGSVIAVFLENSENDSKLKDWINFGIYCMETFTFAFSGLALALGLWPWPWP